MFMVFVYEVQSHEYAEFTHKVLLHEKKYSAEEFKEIVETVRQHVKPDEDDWEAFINSSFPDDIITCLVDDFGFVKSDHPVIHVGYDFDSKCEILRRGAENGLFAF